MRRILLDQGLAPHAAAILRHHGLDAVHVSEIGMDHHGDVAMGVDPDTGTPIRGGGHGFEQDILVYDLASGGRTSVVPLIFAEVKFGSVTTHDVIVYAEKADRIRRVYPYLRYGLFSVVCLIFRAGCFAWGRGSTSSSHLAGTAPR